MANQTTDSGKLNDKLSELQTSISNQFNANENQLKETVGKLSTEIKAKFQETVE